MNEIWEFSYTDCIHESAMAAISLHKSKKGAEMAMEHHKNEARKEFAKRDIEAMKAWGITFGMHEEWVVCKRDVLP